MREVCLILRPCSPDFDFEELVDSIFLHSFDVWHSSDEGFEVSFEGYASSISCTWTDCHHFLAFGTYILSFPRKTLGHL